MLTDKQILKETGLLIVEKDEQGNIIRPQNKLLVKQYTDILDATVSINNQVYNPTTENWYEIKEKVLFDESTNTNHTIYYIRDITDHKTCERNAQIDYVTKINNRTSTNELTNEYIKKAIENKESFAVILADLDGFKEINDSYGHFCGDEILNKVANIIYSTTRHDNKNGRSADIVGRFGGDEFYYLLTNITRENALKKAKFHIKKVEGSHIIYDGKKVKLPTLSLGLYYVNADELKNVNKIDDFRSEIFRKADKALYYSKNNGKNKAIDYDAIKKFIQK